MNAFPEYSADSRDKPAGFNDDPEKGAQMDTVVRIRKSLICFYNQPDQKSVACEGDIDFHINKGCIKEIKQKI
jgi:hypothetical protein